MQQQTTPRKMKADELSEEQLNDLREAFDLFDRNKDGRITAIELQTVMHSLRLEPSDEELKNMISQADIDGNGSVEFNEFIVMMSVVKERRIHDDDDEDDVIRRRKQEAEALQAFRVFDIDGDGLIDPEELKQTMSNLGEVLTDADVGAMIKAADRNDDGKIDFEEFRQMMRCDR